MDNSTTCFYVSKMGGTRSPNLMEESCRLWRWWCLQRDITLSVEYLPGTSNWVADRESCQVQTSAEWKLDERVFRNVCQKYGPCQVDLFASRLNHQLEKYVSWRPDPFAMATNALQISWSELKGCAFPPFALIGRCLMKVRTERCTVLLIAPCWRTQTWYPVLLELLVDYPIFLPEPERPSQPATSAEGSSACCLESIRQQHTSVGVLKQAAELLAAGWSKGTNTAYQSGWRRWHSWCHSREIDPIHCGIQPF